MFLEPQSSTSRAAICPVAAASLWTVEDLGPLLFISCESKAPVFCTQLPGCFLIRGMLRGCCFPCHVLEGIQLNMRWPVAPELWLTYCTLVLYQGLPASLSRSGSCLKALFWVPSATRRCWNFKRSLVGGSWFIRGLILNVVLRHWLPLSISYPP